MTNELYQKERNLMVPNSSLDEHVNKVVKRYSSLFTLPSHRKIVVWLCALCVLGGLLAIFPLCPTSFGLALGLIFGAAVFSVTLMSDFIIRHSFMGSDPIFNLRRCSALSLFSCLTWFGFIFLGSLISVFLGNTVFWVKFFFLGFSVALILRLLVFSTTSFADFRRVFVSSLLQPALCVIPLLFMARILDYSLGARHLLFLSLSIPVAVLATLLFTFLVNRVGRRALGIASIPLFKAFMANWTEDLNAPLEGFFERLGCERDVKFSMLAFRTGGRTKAVIVVPAFHSGPFRNVGSSFFPYMIKDALENNLQCVAAVPHGLTGHELDLSSQLQTERAVKRIVGSVDFSHFLSRATPLVRAQKSNANASCQVFGDCALLTLTLAPKTMEDLPPELGSVIVNEAEKRGLSSALVVDAHNSIDGPFNLNEALEPLRKAALASMDEALSLERAPFEVGAAKVVPEEFGIRDGMGLGGISVIATRVGDQTTAYVTIDGNNMVSGLREKILSALREIDIVDGEVLTTDTHSVTGVVLTARGYHPIGEAIDQAKLIGYIRQAAMDASSDLEPAEASWRTETVSGVNVIGEKQIEALCLLAEKAAREAKRLAVSLFSVTGVLLVALLTLL